MTVFLWDHKLTYVSVPKVACTSLKHMFFEIENGRRFENYKANGKNKHIHNAAYPGKTFGNLPHERIADHVRLTVVRDPVERLLSCYAHRVMHLGELSAKHIKPEFQEHGATPNPSLEEFVDKLALYREASASIRGHARPFVDILGRDPDYFEGVYSIGDLDSFRRRVCAIIGYDVAIPHVQKTRTKLPPDDLGSAARRRIEEFYAEDYEIYGAYF